MTSPKRISVLGSTGSVGVNTLDLIRRAPAGTYEVVALTANTNISDLAAQAREFDAQIVAIADEAKFKDLKDKLSGTDTQVVAGRQGLAEAAAKKTDWTMAAIVGAAGLEPTLIATEQGASIALANKECLVSAGDYFISRAKDSGAIILPVDSEHNAIFQVLNPDHKNNISRIILTASGGPFLNRDASSFGSITRQDALNHPTWDMGAKISIDSATLMNKGLELIEAAYLFDMPSSMIDIIVHPQSIIHSMVEYCDGSVLAQLGSADMRVPIASALAWPNRMETPAEKLDFAALKTLDFQSPDVSKFPCLKLARNALELGGLTPCVLNAANEVAVAAFLNGDLSFPGIPRVVESTLDAAEKSGIMSSDVDSLDTILNTDTLARQIAQGLLDE